MARRKTIDIVTLVDDVNYMLMTSRCDPAIRRGMTVVLERMLHETNNYDGFRYLRSDEVPEGFKPGIDPSMPHDNPDARYPDESRRQYGCKTKPSKTQ